MRERSGYICAVPIAIGILHYAKLQKNFKQMKYGAMILLFSIFTIQSGCGQKSSQTGHVHNPDFDQKISNTIDFSIPVIGVKELKNIQDEVLIFDAREKEEFEVSHIPGARFLGYNNFSPNRLSDIPKETKIVLYCSIGYRSEKIGERLQKLGYSNVYNLYGSLFEWVNQGNPVVTKNGTVTNKVHTYNRSWSKWVDGQKVEKIW